MGAEEPASPKRATVGRFEKRLLTEGYRLLIPSPTLTSP